jgi:hypothetical protein
MHTFTGPRNTIFNYNSDLSGLVDITTPDGMICVPGDDLLCFISNHVRQQKIVSIEGLSVRAILELREQPNE